MKTTIFALLALLSLSACNAQQEKGKTTALKNKPKQEQPAGNWEVHKQFDENGNLTSYDSTYTYSSGTYNGREIPQENMDSLLTAFHNFFSNSTFAHPGKSINPFSGDTLNNQQDFFNNNFFSPSLNAKAPAIEQQIRQMDSLRLEFLKKNYPQMFKELEKAESNGQKLPSESSSSGNI